MTLTLQELSVEIKGVKILKNVSLSVGEREVVCVLGRNGAGKTMLARVIMGHEKQSYGKIIINGVDATFLDTHERVRLGLGYIPQEGGAFPDLTVEENLRAATTITLVKPSSIGELLKIFPQLAGKARLRARYLSGGEQRMLSIAMTLASNPGIVVMDEPTGGLMPQLLERLAEIIKNLKSSSKSVLLLEQKVEFALKVADRVVIIDRGVIVAELDPQTLRSREDLISRYIGIPKPQQ
jgi:ABC-type branched-subunit amino acid transport system ATPase component